MSQSTSDFSAVNIGAGAASARIGNAMSRSDASMRRPGGCTVERHVYELVTSSRNAYLDGRRRGLIAGHEAGYTEGYLIGYGDGQRGSCNYRAGAANGYTDGYLNGVADSQAKSGRSFTE